MAEERMLEVWGGFECSVVRLGSTYRNQIVETGHAARPDDIERAYALGLRTLRYPALWETISPDDPERCDWGWHDRRFEQLRRLGIRPIVGLVHHGSGPRYTDLLDPAFPELLGRHAGHVARRYPWVEAWTPVNEPLTTARFSALYGHWYPHRSDIGSFLRATVAQCTATVLAMRAIRRIVPEARLIQTEDIGKTFSTPDLAGQARFENERRWLSLDLLCGFVDPHHPWWTILSRHGITPAELDIFRAGDVRPDIIGVNHYLTSERVLDSDWRRYPAAFQGGNGVQRYADVEAVRVPLPTADLGIQARLLEVIGRYGRPVAVTEVHHGCTREEQLRWLAEIWGAAAALRSDGADVRAVTVWSLAGAVDWNSLLMARRGAYEPGAFDVRAPAPRVTALGQAVTALIETGTFSHPTLGPGWWRRPERLYARPDRTSPPLRRATASPLLILGGLSGLAEAFARICTIRGLAHVIAPATSPDCEWEDLIDACRPWAVADLSGLGAPTGADGAEALALATSKRDLALLVVSSVLVFDGRRDRPYVESDRPCPADRPGVVALDRERVALALNAKTLVVRTGPVFGVPVCSEEVWPDLSLWPFDPESLVSLSFVPDFVHAALDLLVDGESGVWHLANANPGRWGGIAAALAEAARAPEVESRLSQPGAARRTLALASEKTWTMPPLEDAIARYAHDMRCRPTAPDQIAAE